MGRARYCEFRRWTTRQTELRMQQRRVSEFKTLEANFVPFFLEIKSGKWGGKKGTSPGRKH